MQLRNCVIDGRPFYPKRKGQRACGRECGIKLQALVHRGKAPVNDVRDPAKAKRYGYDYQVTRAQWKTKVDAGTEHCRRCGKWIRPGTPWDLGHDDLSGEVRGPEHRACNRATATHKAKRRQRWEPSRVGGTLPDWWPT